MKLKSKSNILNINDFYIFYILYFLVLPLGFFIRILYSKSLTPMEFGIIYSLLSFFSFILVFTNFGFSASLGHYIPKYIVAKKYEKIKNLFYYSFIIQFILTLLASIGIFIFASFIAENYFHNMEVLIFLKIFLIYFISLNLFRTLTDVFLAYKMNVYYQVISFLQMFFILIFSLFFYLIGDFNLVLYYSYIWAFVTLFFFIVSIFFLFYKFRYLLSIPSFDKVLIKEHFEYSWYMFLNAIGNNLLSNVDILMITYFFGVAEVAYYSNALALVIMLTSIFSSFSIVFMTIFSELKEKEDYESLRKVINYLYTLIIYLIIPISLVFFLFSKEIMVLIYGQEYILGAGALMMLSLFSIFKVLSKYNLFFINGLGLGKKLLYLVIPVVVFNLITNYFFIKWFSIEGAAVSTGIAWVLLTVFGLKIISKDINLNLDVKKLIKIFFLFIIFILTVFFLKWIIVFENIYLEGITVLGISFLIYLVLGYLLNVYKFSEFYLFLPQVISSKVKPIHQKYFKFLK